VVDGKVASGDTVVMMNTGKEYTLDEIGVLAPVKTPVSDCLLQQQGPPQLHMMDLFHDLLMDLLRSAPHLWGFAPGQSCRMTVPGTQAGSVTISGVSCSLLRDFSQVKSCGCSRALGASNAGYCEVAVRVSA